MLPISLNIPRLQPKSSSHSDKKSRKTENSDFLSMGSASSVAMDEKKDIGFSEMLEQIAPASNEKTRDINQLWKELPHLERDLIQTKSQDALEKYKNQVRLLLSTILEKNTNYRIIYSPISGTTQKKEFTHLEYLDEKLKLLAEIISHPQNSAFQILKQMDNIKGFLMDVER